MSSHDIIQDLIAAVISAIVAWITSRFTLSRTPQSKTGAKP